MTVQEAVDGQYVEKKYSGHRVSQWENPFETLKDIYFRDHSLEFLRQLPEGKPFAMFTYLVGASSTITCTGAICVHVSAGKAGSAG